MISDRRTRVERLGPFLLLGILVFAVAVVFWARNRGLDITDEGFYLQLLANPDSGVWGVPTQFHVLADLVGGPFHPGIVGYRVAGLVILLASTAFFAWAVLRFTHRRLPRLAERLPPTPTVIGFATLCGLLGYAWVPLAMSYNTVGVALAQVISALALLSAAIDRYDRALAAAAGALLPFLFYAKPPAATATFLLLAGFYLIVTTQHRHLFGWFVLSGAFVLLIVTEETLLGPFSLERLSSGSLVEGRPLTVAGGHIRSLGRAVTWLPGEVLHIAGLIGLILGGWLAVRPGRRLSAWLLPAAGLVLAATGIPNRQFFSKFVVAMLVAVVLSAVGIRWIKDGRFPRISVSKAGTLTTTLLAVLLLLPLATAVGTDNNIMFNALIGGAGFGLFVILVLGLVSDETSRLPFWGLVLPALGVLVAVQVYQGVVAQPYRLPTALGEQNTPVEGVPRLQGMRLDPAGAATARDLYALVYGATGFEPGDPVVAIARIPGFVYLIEGVAPGPQWISRNADSDDLCAAFDAEGDLVARTTLFLENLTPDPAVVACLAEMIPGYPESLVEVGAIDLYTGWGAEGIPELRVLELRP